MASKGLDRVLRFIGLVEDEEPEDSYEGGYPSDDYGRQPAYTPPRQPVRQPQGGGYMTPRRNNSAVPTRAPQSSRNGNRSRFGSPAPRTNNSTRRPPQQTERRPYNYDQGYGPSGSRFGSLDGAPADAQRSVPRGSSRPRTVMFTLRNLEDCCDVIDNLIIDNTVVLTMDELDMRVMQRAVDTLSGAVFALHATIRKASEHTYLIAPAGVEVNETYDIDSRY